MSTEVWLSWLRVGILYVVSGRLAADLYCELDENVCFHGTNLNVDFGSGYQGCRELPSASSCCDLCGEYWPDCQSWTYMKSDPPSDSSYAGMHFKCCLKTTLGPDREEAAYCDSGSQTPRCTITSTSVCSLEVYGSGFSSSDSAVVLSHGDTCGDATATLANWSGFTNPVAVADVDTAPAPDVVIFNLGIALSGAVGAYPLCHRAGAGTGSLDEYTQPVGYFLMRGPSTNQSFSCMLGDDCTLALEGVGFPGSYSYVLIVAAAGAGSADEPCGAGAAKVSFSGVTNPQGNDDDDYDNTFALGVATDGSTVSGYAVCWASDPASEQDYSQHVGTFYLQGPESSSYACVLGAACQLLMQGRGLVDNHALLVGYGDDSSACGSAGTIASFGSAFSNPSLPSAVALDGNSANFTLGISLNAHNNEPGSKYRICWTSSPSETPPSYTLSDYAIVAGIFTLYGPVTADYECEFTMVCNLTFTGAGLDQLAWSVLIVGEGGECGSADPVAGGSISGGTWTNPAIGTSSGHVSLGIATYGLASSTYVICWGADAVDQTGYKVQLGVLAMHGPAAVAGTTCIKGLACTLELSCPNNLTSCGLTASNRLLVLVPGSACGVVGAVQATFSPMVTEKAAEQAGDYYLRYTLGYPNVGTAQTGYTLCWGASPSSFSEYSFTLGDFAVYGPNPVNATCTLGLACIVQLSGVSFAATNRVLVIQSGSCGDSPADVADLDGMTTTKLVTSSDPYDTYQLSTPIAGKPGTGYQVCWGHEPGSNGGDELYKVAAAELVIHGPVQAPQICTLGVACSVRLNGTALAASNKVLIIESTSTCGDASPTIAAFSGIVNPQNTSTDDPGLFELGLADTTSGGVGSSYWICWGFDPTDTADYKVTLGAFTIYGPDPENLVECTMGHACSLILSSHEGLASTNRILITSVTDECGQVSLDLASLTGLVHPVAPDASRHDTFSLGTPVHGMPGDYKVCWAHNPSTYIDYVVEVATLRLNGPVPKSTECILSEPCHIALSGVNLAHLSQVFIISEENSCGDAAPTLGSWTGMSNPAGSALPAPDAGGLTYATVDIYDAGDPSAGSVGSSYKLCWSFTPGGDSTDYNVLVGRFTMRGPVQGASTFCALGAPCNIRLNGIGLAATNMLQIVTDDGTCGDAGATLANFEGVENPKKVTDDNTDDTYMVGVITGGGSYSECRVGSPAAMCIGTHYKLCWAHGVTLVNSEPNYVVEVGTFALQGPYATYTVECSLGAICAFRLYGAELSTSNRILFMETSGICGQAAPPIVKVPGLQNPQRAAEADGQSATFRLGRSTGGLAGQYRLCWGADPRDWRQYVVDVGSFQFKAPLDNSCLSSKTGFCIAGMDA